MGLFSYSLSGGPLLVYGNTTDVGMLVLYSANVLDLDSADKQLFGCGVMWKMGIKKFCRA